MEIFFVILGIIFVAIGVICIYDGRKLTKKLFSFQDINEGTKYMKIFGLVVAVLGLFILYFYLPEATQILKEM